MPHFDTLWKYSCGKQCSDAGHQSSLETKVAGIIEIRNQYFPSDQSLTWQPTVWTSTKSKDTEHYKHGL